MRLAERSLVWMIRPEVCLKRFLVSHTFVAILSFVVIRALTVIAANSVYTGASVLARLVQDTLVHI